MWTRTHSVHPEAAMRRAASRAPAVFRAATVDQRQLPTAIQRLVLILTAMLLPIPLRQRLPVAKHLLTTGKPWGDMIPMQASIRLRAMRNTRVHPFRVPPSMRVAWTSHWEMRHVVPAVLYITAPAGIRTSVRPGRFVIPSAYPGTGIVVRPQPVPRSVQLLPPVVAMAAVHVAVRRAESRSWICMAS